MELPNRPTKDPYQEIPVKDFSYINTQKNQSPKARKKTVWIVVAALILVILLGGGAYALFHHTKPKNVKHTSSSTKTKTTPSNNPQNSTANIPTTSYTSTLFNANLSYPTAWSVSQTSNELTITSPEMALTTDTGKSVEGKVVFNMLNQKQLPAGFGTSSVAVLNSQDVTFTSPTANQAAQTYISFVQYPATTVKGGMDAIYVTGNNGYLKTDVITAAQVNQVSPLIFTNFVQCPDNACSSPTALTISSTMWTNSSFSTPIVDMVKSLQFN